jgi:two-component SAPR family response regulator
MPTPVRSESGDDADMLTGGNATTFKGEIPPVQGDSRGGGAEPTPEKAPAPFVEGNPRPPGRAVLGGAAPDGALEIPRDRLMAELLTREPADEPLAAAPLVIRCFGSLQVRHAGRSLAPRQHLKAWELLQLLAAHPPRTITREKLNLALWPDPDMPLSQNASNMTVSRLREELTAQIPGLSRDVVQRARNGDCWLDPDLVSVDVHEWLAIIEREPKLHLLAALAEYRRAHQLYRPTLLDGAGFDWLCSREGDGLDLAAAYRDTWRRYTLRLARRSVREDRPDLAVPLYRRLMDERPRDEAVTRELYRCYGGTGDLRGLEREARILARALREGYGDDQDESPDLRSEGPEPAEPEKETQRVYEEVRRALVAAGGRRMESLCQVSGGGAGRGRAW